MQQVHKGAAAHRRAVVLVAALAFALCLFMGVGHGVHNSMSPDHDGMAGTAIGLCLILVTLVVRFVTRAPRLTFAWRTRPYPAIPRSHAIVIEVTQQARASPVLLQRFRN